MAPRRRRRSHRRGPGPLRLVGYVRVSTEEQAQHGVSLDAQRERLGAYAVAHAAELLGIEADNGASGKVAPEARQGLGRALARVRSGDADGLLVVKLDRLSRSTRHVLDLVDECGRDAWRLISVSEHLDTGTAAGRLVVTVLAALAQMEREQVGERTRFALDRIAREGRARSRFTPFGFRTESGASELRAGDSARLVPDPTEEPIRQRMLKLRADGLGAGRIAAALNARGDVNPRTRRPWSPQLVQRLLYTLERREKAAGGGA